MFSLKKKKVKSNGSNTQKKVKGGVIHLGKERFMAVAGEVKASDRWEFIWQVYKHHGLAGQPQACSSTTRN